MLIVKLYILFRFGNIYARIDLRKIPQKWKKSKKSKKKYPTLTPHVKVPYRAVDLELSVFYFHFSIFFNAYIFLKVLWIARKCARINFKKMKIKHWFLQIHSSIVDFIKMPTVSSTQWVVYYRIWYWELFMDQLTSSKTLSAWNLFKLSFERVITIIVKKRLFMNVLIDLFWCFSAKIKNIQCNPLIIS